MPIRATVSMTNNFTAAAGEALGRLVEGMNLAAERGLALAVDRAPMDQGTLIENHTVDPSTDPDDAAAIVADTPYAARLHEHPEYNFATDANPRAQGKWIENAVVENKAELGAIIRQRVRGDG